MLTSFPLVYKGIGVQNSEMNNTEEHSKLKTYVHDHEVQDSVIGNNFKTFVQSR